jgi:hypothetical protein
MYYILKNPFKTTSLEKLLYTIGQIPYFYDRSGLLGAYTCTGTAFKTSQEYLENSGSLYSTGCIYLAHPDDELISIRDSVPVNFKESPNGWLIGRIDEHWKWRIEEDLNEIARNLEDTYYQLTFPDHPEGDFYIIESDVPVAPVSTSEDIQTALEHTYDEVISAIENEDRIAEKLVEKKSESNYFISRTSTYIPLPVCSSPSYLLFRIHSILRKHFGYDARLSVITPNNEILSRMNHKSYKWYKLKCGIRAPYGWIVMSGSPEKTCKYIEKIYTELNCTMPSTASEVFAPSLVEEQYNLGDIIYYPVDSTFYTPIHL